MDWSDYFYKEFNQDLMMFNSQRKAVDCEHHPIPNHLAWFVDELRNYNFPKKFFFCWFGISLIDQVLFSHFQMYFRYWKSKFGEHPVPMRGGGMGCLRWDNPIWLIERYCPVLDKSSEQEFISFLNFLFSITFPELKELGIDKSEFLRIIKNDEHIHNRQSIEAITFKNFL
jgi:hypothetical protein